MNTESSIRDIEFEIRRERDGIKTVCLVTLRDGNRVESIPNTLGDHSTGSQGLRKFYRDLCQDWGLSNIEHLSKEEVFSLHYHFFPEPHPVEEKLTRLQRG